MNETVTVPLNEYLKIKAVYDNPRMNDEEDKKLIEKLTNRLGMVERLNQTYEELKESRKEEKWLRECAVREEHVKVVRELNNGIENLQNENRKLVKDIYELRAKYDELASKEYEGRQEAKESSKKISELKELQFRTDLSKGFLNDRIKFLAHANIFQFLSWKKEYNAPK